ncbi:MAG: restriction endonuclease subunit S [Dehalococcoidia bacterium]|nr:MAG: restriction endonuclease subunit S [Dehalococcoidia bacterium]
MPTATTTIPKGYKQTEIGMIPVDWDVKKMSEVITFANGKPHENHVIPNGVYKLITLDSIGIDGKLKTEHRRIGAFDGSLKKGDIVMVLSDIAHAKLLGLCDLIPENNKYVLNQRMGRLRLIHADDPSYIRLQINSKQDHFRSRGQGTSQRHIYQRDVDELEIPLPPKKSEQTAIATTLSDTDALIEKLEKLIEKKKNIKQGAMQELLTSKRRLPGFSGKWEKSQLGNLAQIYQSQTISQNKFSNDGYLVYGANGVVGKYKDYNHNKWQTIVTCRGSTCGTVNKTVGKCWITGNAMVINVDQNNSIDKLFFYYLLSRQDFTNCITGTEQPQIVRNPLSAFEVVYPTDKTEQSAIAVVFTDMDTEIELLGHEFEKYKQVKTGMMQQLLTGKIRII